MFSGPFTVLLLVPPDALSKRRLNKRPLQQICNNRRPWHGGVGWRTNSVPTEHDLEVMCLGSEHEKDAERGREVAEGRREDAERGPEDVEQSLARRRCDVCVRHHR